MKKYPTRASFGMVVGVVVLAMVCGLRCGEMNVQEPALEASAESAGAQEKGALEATSQEKINEVGPPDGGGSSPESSVETAPEVSNEATSDGAAKALTHKRPWSPVVLKGSRLMRLQGIPVDALVAFRYDGSQQQWVQIPVQVDERKVMEYYEIYNKVTNCPHNFYLKGPSFKNLVYADKDTHTGADTDPNLDADDEVVVMFRDAGEQASSFSLPKGAVAGTGVELAIQDPMTPSQKAYVYFFRQDGSLQASAGKKYVEYKFGLKSGDYKTTYQHCGNRSTAQPANPEDSSITTPYYTRHFSDRWISDGFSILAPLGTGVDLLDMHKALYGPGICSRSVITFSSHEGAFVANISGPVRAIRSYIGANSGPLVQRQHFFYERREDMVTHLRVHTLGKLMFGTDYSSEAKGMRYANNLNPDGVTIDGREDSPTSGALQWEYIQGQQGNLLHLFSLDTDLKLNPVTYFLDQAPASTTQCSGDSDAYGFSAVWVNQEIGNTDPRRGTSGEKVATFVMHNTFLVEEKSLDPQLATLRYQQTQQPLQVSLATVDAKGRGPVCGDGSCESTETATSCAVDCSKTVCGNGVCEDGETAETCRNDCKPSTCGNAKCDTNEDQQNCPEDCKPQTNCGDGVCDAFETADTCAQDCSPGAKLLACLRSKCAQDVSTCQKDSDCVAIYQCFIRCKDSQQQCLSGCSQNKSAATTQRFQSLLSCGKTQQCW